jgi:hypothetical protein
MPGAKQFRRHVAAVVANPLRFAGISEQRNVREIIEQRCAASKSSIPDETTDEIVEGSHCGRLRGISSTKGGLPAREARLKRHF